MPSKSFEIKHGLNVRNGDFAVDETGNVNIAKFLNVGNGKVTVDPINGILVNGEAVNVAPDTTGLNENTGVIDLPTGTSLFPATIDGVEGKILAIKQSESDNNPQELFFGQSDETIKQLTRIYQSSFTTWVENQNFDTYTEGSDGSVLNDDNFGVYVNNPTALSIIDGNLTINSANMPDNGYVDVETNYDIEAEGAASSDPQGDFDIVMEMSNLNLDTNFSYRATDWYPSDTLQSLSVVGIGVDLAGDIGYVCVAACNHPDPSIGQSWGVFSYSIFAPNNLNNPDVFVPRSTNFGKVRITRNENITKFYYSEGTDSEGKDVWNEIPYNDTSGWEGKAWETIIFATGGTTTTATISKYQIWAEYIQLEAQGDYLVQTDPHEASEGWSNWKDITTDTLLSNPITLKEDFTVNNQTVSGKLIVNDFEDIIPITFDNVPESPKGINLVNNIYTIYDQPENVSFVQNITPISYNYVNIDSNTFSMATLNVSDINSAGSGEPYKFLNNRNHDIFIASDYSVSPAVCNVYDITSNTPTLKSSLSRTETTETEYGSVATMARDWLFVKETSDTVGNILINVYSYDGASLTYSNSITKTLGDYTLQKIASNGVYMAASYYNSITGNGYIDLYKYDNTNWSFNQTIDFTGISDQEFGINLSISRPDNSGRYHILTSSPNFGSLNSGKVYFYQINISDDILSNAIELESPKAHMDAYGLNFGKVAKVLNTENNNNIHLVIYEHNPNYSKNKKIYLYEYNSFRDFSISEISISSENYLFAGVLSSYKELYDVNIRNNDNYITFSFRSADGIYISRFETNSPFKELKLVQNSDLTASNAFIAFSDSYSNVFVYNSLTNNIYNLQRQYIGSTIDNTSPLPITNNALLIYNNSGGYKSLICIEEPNGRTFYKDYGSDIWINYIIDSAWEEVSQDNFTPQTGGKYYISSSYTNWYMPSASIGDSIEFMLNSTTGTLSLASTRINGVTNVHTILDSSTDTYYVKIIYTGNTLGWTYT